MKNISINYYGYFTPFGGYGIANLNWITHLTRLGVDVSCHKKFSYQRGTPEYEALTPEQIEILEKPFERRKIGIIETTPFDFETNESEFKIANTMSESDRLGKPWVEACNAMDIIAVPDEWNRESFLQSGVKESKLRIIRHGTWTEMFPYYERPKRDIFTFGTIGYLNDRKGVFELIRAFTSEFSKDEPVRLYLKSSNKDFGYYSRFTDDRIITDVRHLLPADLRDMYNSFDCFVFPSKAEGVGQPPREAMSTGLPTIVTSYSGMYDIADPMWCYPLIPKELVEGQNPQIVEQPGNWAQIDIRDLMVQMRYVYEHQQEAKEKGELASRIMRQYFSWEVAAQQMVKLLEELV